jgi:hypothetical protein
MREENEGKVRFGRAQRFRLSPKGTEAVTAYAAVIEDGRAGTGRAGFDAARQAWSAPRGLTAEDGLFLMEFQVGERTLAEAARSLEGCGTRPKELKAAVERLLECGMLEPVPAAPVEPAPPPRRYW